MSLLGGSRSFRARRCCCCTSLCNEIIANSIVIIVLILARQITGDKHVAHSNSDKPEDRVVKISSLLSHQSVLVPVGNSTSADFIKHRLKEFPSTSSYSSVSASSLNSNKFVSVPLRKESNGIISYSALLPVSHVGWLVDSLELAGSMAKEEDAITNAHVAKAQGKVDWLSADKKNNVEITPLQEELIFVIQSNPGEERGMSVDGKSTLHKNKDRIALFEKHVNDPDFILSDSSSKITLLIPLSSGSQFEHLSALCNNVDEDKGTDFSNHYDKSSDNIVKSAAGAKVSGSADVQQENNKKTSKPHRDLPTSAWSDVGDSNGNDDTVIERPNQEIRRSFRMISHLLEFRWSEVKEENGLEEENKADEEMEKSETHSWLSSCPAGITCKGEAEPLSVSALQLSNNTLGIQDGHAEHNVAGKPEALYGSKPFTYFAIQTEVNTSEEAAASSSLSVTSSRSTSTLTSAPPSKRRLVKVSHSQAFTASHKCQQGTKQAFPSSKKMRTTQSVMKKSKPIQKINRNIDNIKRDNNSLLIVDLYPVFQHWLQRHEDCLGRIELATTFVFSLKMEEIRDRDPLHSSKPSTNNLFSFAHFHSSSSDAAAIDGLRVSRGDEQAFLKAEYKIDERCAIPIAEVCPVGICSKAAYVFKFRPECSPTETETIQRKKKGAWRALVSKTVAKVKKAFVKRVATTAVSPVKSCQAGTAPLPIPPSSLLSSSCSDTTQASTILFQECVHRTNSDRLSLQSMKMLSDNQKSCLVEDEILMGSSRSCNSSCNSSGSNSSSTTSSTKVKIKKCKRYLKSIMKEGKVGEGSVGGTGSLFWKWTLILLFIVSVSIPSTSAQGWDRSRFGRSDNNARRSSSQLCDSSDENETILGTSCDFEEACQWTWVEPGQKQTGFRNVTPQQVIAKMREDEWKFRGPAMDTKNKTDGHFLLLAWEDGANTSARYTLTSPWFTESQQSCRLEARTHMHNMQFVAMNVVIVTKVSTMVPLSKLGDGLNAWEHLRQPIGRVKEPFQIILEVDNNARSPSYFAIDDIKLVDCFPSNKTCKTSCSEREFQCGEGKCIDRNRLCDLNKDCLYGEDEKQNCDLLPKNASCTFENGWCGWHPLQDVQTNLTWERTNKPTYVKGDSVPRMDHTFMNSTGFYLFVDMKVKDSNFHRSVLRSPIFAHPPAYNQNSSSPYYQSCQLRFFYHMFGAHVGSLDVELVPKNSRNPWTKPYRFCERVGNQGNIWHRASCKLPSFKGSKKYYLQLTAIRGTRGAQGDIAIDDISLSPECFGIGVPVKEVGSYNYEAILKTKDEVKGNLTTALKFSTCNSTGRTGPSQEQCDASYNGTLLSGKIKVDAVRNGVQIWTVPETKSYTLIAKGASGGRGALLNQMTSHGSIVKTAVYLKKGEQLYILVGQEGISGCDQSGSKPGARICVNQTDSLVPTHARIFQRRRSRDAPAPTPGSLNQLKLMNKIVRGGGGGGGATIVFKMNGKTPTPILIAAGGGGLGFNASAYIMPHGKGLNVTLEPHSGITQSWGAGGGGGWEGDTPNVKTSSLSTALDDLRRSVAVKERDNATMLVSAGLSLIDGGGLGGFPCEQSDPWGAAGGFGGGGGGCVAGGGGGGYVGGHAHSSLSANGEGGWSYIGKGGLHHGVDPGGHSGPGELVVIPSFEGCGCEFQCVLLDDYEMHSGCVCPENSIPSEDGITCVGRESLHIVYVAVLVITATILFCVVGALCFCLYNRYQRQKMSMIRRKMMGGPELQLSRLRAASGPGGVLTEYNPNYEFGGETYTLTDLKEIPRENLRLVKALGQGAFGEVYQGFYRHRDGDAVEMPVAVKTLPALSSNQAEMDFLMEALIMSKFNHPNIVHFIGVCFDKHPRFIILELLAGGDLKSFLRESRPKPDKASPLAMRDLLLCAMDVAKGCKYLEDNHFIHRDIAARNCLLTTKGPGRVVKIADFGMARDIYRADYYKKGGKAMLPVKWMPPEAFLDGIFTSKTDVWSYGVLLWEIFSLGYMPYPGRGNQDVMQLITNGGRLEPPSNCPPPVYGIMTQCWHPIPDERPNFSTLLERVGYCLQDPEVVNAPLPVFQRPPSSERDTTLMRPPNPEHASCLRIVQGNRYSISTTPDMISSPNSSTADYLVPLTHYSFSTPTSPPPRPDSIPTSPTTPIPESESTETMLDEEEPGTGKSSKDSSTKYADVTVNSSSSGANSSNASSSNLNKPNANGIETGVTLSAAGLEKMDSRSSSSGTRRPAQQYANVGVSKPRLPSPVKTGSGGAGASSNGTGNQSEDEEIRC